MLHFKIDVSVKRSLVSLHLDVYAENTADATTLVKAYMLTKGIEYQKYVTKLAGGAPVGAKAGIVERKAPAETDFAALEARVLAHALTDPMLEDIAAEGGDVYADVAVKSGITREQAKAAILSYLYTPQSTIGLSPTGRAPAPRNDAPTRRARYTEGRGYVNLYCKADGHVQAGNVYRSREEAQQAAKYPDKARVAFITWNATGADNLPPAPPRYYHHLTDGQRRHLGNRLKAWMGVRGMDSNANIYINASDDSDYVLISFGSPRWKECLERCKVWLREQNVALWPSTQSMVRVRWQELAQYVWPL